MFSFYSKGCEYAIRALSEMAGETAGTRFRASDICRRAGIPEAYARKTFQSLVQTGFLNAGTGPGGGYSLCRAPEKISLLDVVLAVEGESFFSGCVLGFPSCGSNNPCSLHDTWRRLKETMLAALASKNLKEISIASSKKIRRVKK